jgi:hypothetical protein
MPACPNCFFDDLDSALARRERCEPSVIEAHDAAEATAMQNVAAHLLHGYF